MPMLRTAAGATIAFAAFLLVAPPAHADAVRLTAALSGKNEVPPIQSAASGNADMTLDTASRTLTWTIAFRGLSGESSGAHFHGQASVSENAPVMVPIGKRGDKSPLMGSKVLTPGQMAALLAGRWYINIHTAAHPPGEIRGQVVRR